MFSIYITPSLEKWSHHCNTFPPSPPGPTSIPVSWCISLTPTNINTFTKQRNNKITSSRSSDSLLLVVLGVELRFCDRNYCSPVRHFTLPGHCFATLYHSINVFSDVSKLFRHHFKKWLVTSNGIWIKIDKSSTLFLCKRGFKTAQRALL